MESIMLQHIPQHTPLHTPSRDFWEVNLKDLMGKAYPFKLNFKIYLSNFYYIPPLLDRIDSHLRTATK